MDEDGSMWRRLGTRRAVGGAVGAAVVLGVVGGVIATRSPGSLRAAAVRPAAPPAVSYSLRVTVDGQSPMSTQQMLATLRTLMPPGADLSNPRDVGEDSAAGTGLEVDYNDGLGAADVLVWVMPTKRMGGSITCPTPLWPDEGKRPPGALPESCATRTLPDGTLERDAVMYADVYGFYGIDVTDQRPDGVAVGIQVGDGTLGTFPHVDRARPPGTLPQWEAVAEDRAWYL